MKITIGFPEVALITSVFFYQQSWWAGVILASIAVIGRTGDYLVKYQEENERKQQLKEASDALKQSIESLSKTQNKGNFKPTLVFTDPKYDGTPQ